MSGGVDSSVAAALMTEKGFDCMGCTMRLYENDMIGEDLFGTCCSLKDTTDARSVCEKLGIPYNIYHFEAQFTEMENKDSIDQELEALKAKLNGSAPAENQVVEG